MYGMGKDLKGKDLGKNISQRKDGRYQARFTNRFGERPTVYGTTLKEVKNALRQAILADTREQNVANSKMTVDEWFKIWIDVYKEPTIKTTTLTNYKRLYSYQIKNTIGSKKISEVTSLDITTLLSSMSKKYTKGYVKAIHDILYDMFERALADDFCKKNPVKGTKYSGKINRRIKALSITDQVDFINMSKNNFYYNAFIVQLNTGIRLGELSGLCIQDIDLDNNIIHIRHNLVRIRKDKNTPAHFLLSTPKTENSIRDIPINPMCKAALVAQLKNRRNVILPNEFKDLIFYSKRTFLPINQSVYYGSICRVIKKINKERKKVNGRKPVPFHSYKLVP